MEKEELLLTLSAGLPEYSKRQKKLAQYICDNCDRAAFLTADMLAAAAGVSESSVVRFARQLGFEGYSELRRAMQQVIRSRLSVMEQESGGAEELLQEAAAGETLSVRSILCQQNGRGIEAAVRAMTAANRIYIQGMGALAGLALHMSLCLSALGLSTFCVRNGAELHGLGEGDLYISISTALYGRRLSALRYARDRGAATLLICDEELAAGNKLADHRLFAGGSGGVLALIRAIVMALQKELGLSLEQELKDIEDRRREYMAYEYEEN